MIRALIVLFLLFPSIALADITVETTALQNPYVSFQYNTDQVQSAESFTSSVSGSISSVLVTLKKVGTPTGNMTVGIQADSAGVPSNSMLASGVIDVSTLSGTCSDYTITLSAAVDITAETPYWVVSNPSGSLSTSNYVQQCGATSNVYAGGESAYASSVPTWTLDSTSDARLMLTVVTSGSTTTAATSLPFNSSEMLYIYGVVLFMLAVPFWDRILKVSSNEYYE